jgi:hypothetical protein
MINSQFFKSNQLIGDLYGEEGTVRSTSSASDSVGPCGLIVFSSDNATAR